MATCWQLLLSSLRNLTFLVGESAPGSLHRLMCCITRLWPYFNHQPLRIPAKTADSSENMYHMHQKKTLDNKTSHLSSPSIPGFHRCQLRPRPSWGPFWPSWRASWTSHRGPMKPAPHGFTLSFSPTHRYQKWSESSSHSLGWQVNIETSQGKNKMRQRLWQDVDHQMESQSPSSASRHPASSETGIRPPNPCTSEVVACNSLWSSNGCGSKL